MCGREHSSDPQARPDPWAPGLGSADGGVFIRGHVWGHTSSQMACPVGTGHVRVTSRHTRVHLCMCVCESRPGRNHELPRSICSSRKDLHGLGGVSSGSLVRRDLLSASVYPPSVSGKERRSLGDTASGPSLWLNWSQHRAALWSVTVTPRL